MLDRLAVLIHRRRRRFLWGSLVVVLAAGFFGGPVFGLLDSGDDFDDPQAEAVLAGRDVERATGASASPDMLALVRLGAPADSARAQEKLARVATAFKDRGIANVTRYERGGDRALVSKDGRSSYVVATFRSDSQGALDRVENRLERIAGVTVGGGELAQEQVGAQVSEDIARAELLAFPILFLLSFFVFRSLVAALLPLAVGGATILLSFLGMRIVNGAIEPMSIYALNLITGLGLGLAIDYSLFMVSRFREELERGLDTGAALRATMATAGRTVLFSSITVAAALASLLVFPLRFLYSMGVGGLLCALMAALVSLTLLPAILAALGPRVNALSPRRFQAALHRDASGERGGFWYRLSHLVMRRPVPIAAGAAALLIALGIPFLGVKFTGVDASVLPSDRSARVVDDAIERDFPPSRTSPIYIAARGGPGDRAAISRYAERLGALPGVVVKPRIQAGDGLYRIDLVGRGRALDEQAKELVRDVRAVDAPVPVRVGGQTAGFLDQQKALSDSLPIALAILATTTLVILFLMTGSVILPVKALVMNLLTLSAAFGLLVLIFQDGHGEGLLGFTSQGALESSQPVLLFAVAFGLSTDYGVFLLTRIKEAHDAGAPNEEAVALGLERTGRIVTFAALLFVIAIGAFATSQIIFIKQLGVGTALAVLIDATIVRALLVPSLMRLLGDRNWWAPKPLVRLHRRIGLSESGPAPA
jgi:RND superfamily putative drug exporter